VAAPAGARSARSRLGAYAYANFEKNRKSQPILTLGKKVEHFGVPSISLGVPSTYTCQSPKHKYTSSTWNVGEGKMQVNKEFTWEFTGGAQWLSSARPELMNDNIGIEWR